MAKKSTLLCSQHANNNLDTVISFEAKPMLIDSKYELTAEAFVGTLNR
jgi:hypothetical protein